jgi:hypothetical protein
MADRKGRMIVAEISSRNFINFIPRRPFLASVAVMDLNFIFIQFRDKLDAHYDRRERLIKISRDITSLSKKIIFSLQRIQGNVTSLPTGIQKEVDQREKEIQNLLQKAGPDVQGANAYRYQLVKSVLI